MIDELANHDILKMREVVQLSAIECLTYISYKIQMKNIQ
jgi:hypothetical protein